MKVFAVRLDDHDAEQLAMLAKMKKLKNVQTLIKIICIAYLDRREHELK